MRSGKLTKRFLIIAIFLLTVGHLSRAQASNPAFDIVIKNGHIMDGTGSPWYAADLAVKERAADRRHRQSVGCTRRSASSMPTACW